MLVTDTLNLWVQNLYRNQPDVANLNKSSFYNLPKIAMFEFLIYLMENFMNNVMT